MKQVQKELYLFHEECTFITVHRTDCLTVDEVIEEVTVANFAELKLTGFDIKQMR